MRSLIEHAKPLYNFVIDAAIGRFDTTYATGQMGAVKAVAPLIAQIRDRSQRDLYARKATRRIGVDLDIMQREVRSAHGQLHVRDEDAYSPRRRFGAGNGEGAGQPRVEPGSNPYANPAERRALEHRAATEQSYFRIDDAVFICEQQFMATLIQIPRAINRTMFASLNEDSFVAPVFRALFLAIQAAGGLPPDDAPQGLWMHNLNKAGGLTLTTVINELAVLQLPLPPSDQDRAVAGSGVPGAANAAAVQLRPASPAETRYAAELLARLLDMGYMRRIAAARRRMAGMPEGSEKLELLGEITKLETSRKDLQAQVYGNTVG